jgi:hypothetical protein
MTRYERGLNGGFPKDEIGENFLIHQTPQRERLQIIVIPSELSAVTDNVHRRRPNLFIALGTKEVDSVGSSALGPINVFCLNSG